MIANFLKDIPFLSDVSTPRLHTLGGLFTYKIFEEGDFVCEEGEPVSHSVRDTR